MPWSISGKSLMTGKELFIILCLSGQEMAPTGQRPLLIDSWRQNSILWEEQPADQTIAFLVVF